MRDAYQKLAGLSRELRFLRDAGSLLSWDQEVSIPRKAIEYRARQLGWIGGEIHRRFTDPQVGEWIAQCEADPPAVESIEAANLREWRHGYDRATRLPVELVEEFEKTRSLAQSAWAEARKKSDFKAFAPHLEKLIGLCRERAGKWGYEKNAYDALLDEFERGATTEQIAGLFADLRGDLAALVAEALSQEPVDQSRIRGDFPVAKQAAFNREVAQAIGFDLDAGRIDTAAHPFCSETGLGDVRLTTRYDETDFRGSLFGVLHEAGHGLYEQGLPPDPYGLPVGNAVSLGIHESQSRLWENHVGRSLAFWERWLPRAAEYFPHLAGLAPEEMFRAVNQAERSFVRVEADEVTYDLHILLRFEIETAIFNGDLAVRNIPGEWNRRFRELFGLTVRRNALGCLQDIHWSLGIFGYFPTYTLGNLNASHLYAAATGQDPRIEARLAEGDYSGLLDWLRENIHRHGSHYLPGELIARAAGSAASPEAHLRHLRERYIR